MAIRLPNSNESIIGYDTLQTDEVNGTKNDFTTKINQLLNWVDLISDYVIETGSNTNGTWEKWNSGKLVQWGEKSITPNFTLQSQSGLYRMLVSDSDANKITFPKAWVEQPIFKVSGNFSEFIGSGGRDVGFVASGYSIYSAASLTSAIVIQWQAIGKWK